MDKLDEVYKKLADTYELQKNNLNCKKRMHWKSIGLMIVMNRF